MSSQSVLRGALDVGYILFYFFANQLFLRNYVVFDANIHVMNISACRTFSRPTAPNSYLILLPIHK